MDGGEVYRHEATGDHVGGQFVETVFGGGEGDVPGYEVVGFFVFEGGVGLLSFEVGEAFLDDGEGVFGGCAPGAVVGDGDERSDERFEPFGGEA